MPRTMSQFVGLLLVLGALGVFPVLFGLSQGPNAALAQESSADTGANAGDGAGDTPPDRQDPEPITDPDTPGQAEGPVTGLALPRFVATKGAPVRLRKGPGFEFPVELEFLQPGTPVEIVWESQDWREVKFLDGAKGYVHKSLLSGKRRAVSLPPTQVITALPEDQARIIAVLEANVLVSVAACETTWCEIRVKGKRGWVPKSSLYGVYADEVFD
ncbi:MAG: SH3 domain-containing protein [Pseudomonadota bacterium]